MEIVQVNIPDIPILKSVFNTDATFTVWQSIMSFFEEYWQVLLIITIIAVVIGAVFHYPTTKEQSIQPKEEQ